jgi:acetyl esterase/lipase
MSQVDGNQMIFRTFIVILFAMALDKPVTAQEDEIGMKRVPVQVDEAAIPLYKGVAPGSEGASIEEVWTDVGTERWARNVTIPTLLPVLPKAGEANGAAVIVVPGGGFQFVSMDNEGYPIAEWLAERGVAAFVLKYRVMETPEEEKAFEAYTRRMFAPRTEEERIDVSQGIPFAVADAQTALRLVQARSEEWGIDQDRIGMLGFSAGAMTTLVTSTSNGDAPIPDFIGYIYGPMSPVEGLDNPPPMFTALAADDGLFGDQGFGIVTSWRDAGAPVELHYYQNGGHGFGSYKRGVTADAWFDQFMDWMTARGLLDDAPEEQ